MSLKEFTTLPEDPWAERSLLATLFAPGADAVAARIMPTLLDADFVSPAHRAVLKAGRKLLAEGTEINALTLRDALGPDINRVGEFSGLTDILGAEEVSNPDKLLEILQTHRKRRELAKIGHAIYHQSNDLSMKPQDVANEACGQLADLATSTRKGGLKAFGVIACEVDAKREEERKTGKVRKVKTGFGKLDQMTRGGFQPGQLIVLAARPGIGKTSVLLQIIGKAALSGEAVALFSLEMAEEEVHDRTISQVSKVSAADSGRDAQAVYNAKADLSSSLLMIDDQAEITAQDIRSRVDRACTHIGGPLSLVGIDYLQLITSPKDSRGSKQTETLRIAEITRSLKLMAKDRNVPVIVLSQLNREVEKRSGGKPQLSDLRDSGAIEQDADIVIFIHREIKPGPAELQSKDAELILAKNRSGPVGSIRLSWDGDITSYREVEEVTGHSFERPRTEPISWEDEV